MNRKESIIPVLKWAGGKRQIASEVINHLPKEYNTYIEPFLGGGGILFSILPHSAIVNDVNPELINMYCVIKESPQELIELLREHEKLHSEEYYYSVRKWDRSENYDKTDKIKKAARTIYLNRTCYNGLYRVNKKGQFNTPIGSYVHPRILDEKNIITMNKYLNDYDIHFLCGNYDLATSMANENDFVYLDPPYDYDTGKNSFTSYTKQGFTQESQKELKKYCDELSKKGVFFLESNSDTEFICDLYKDYKIIRVKANRNINSKGAGRSEVYELIIKNY